jgi:hypothetical protein
MNERERAASSAAAEAVRRQRLREDARRPKRAAGRTRDLADLEDLEAATDGMAS